MIFIVQCVYLLVSQLLSLCIQALHPELASKLDEFIVKLKECLEVKQSFTMVCITCVPWLNNWSPRKLRK